MAEPRGTLAFPAAADGQNRRAEGEVVQRNRMTCPQISSLMFSLTTLPSAFPPQGQSSRPVAYKFGFLVPLVIIGRKIEKNIFVVGLPVQLPPSDSAAPEVPSRSRGLRLKTITLVPSRASTPRPEGGEEEPLEMRCLSSSPFVWSSGNAPGLVRGGGES